uniref:MI domain-containing protein n=1 Tax=Octopus bimaculoides TaxID=37653 RepID=A0A0L8G7E7_OCTBM
MNYQKWNPPSKQRDGLSVDEKNDLIFRKARGILNKLTPEKFDKLSLELLNVGIDSQLILKGIILLIFEKALDEPKYSSLYAQLCHRLCKDAPNFDHSSSKTITFRRLLLNKCQDEFENRSRATEAFDKKDGPLNDDEAEQYHLAKQKMLGNIKFIGELGKLEMLHEGILHKCIKQLLEKKKNVPVKDMAEDLECLCQIIRTVGRRLDSLEAKFNNRRMQDNSAGGPVGNSIGFGMGGVGTGTSPRSTRRVNPQQTSTPPMFQTQQNHQSLPLAPMQSPLLAQPPLSSVQRTPAFSAPGRDLPQRFMRMNMQPPVVPEKPNSGPEDINLRPYKPFNMLRPSVPNMLSKPPQITIKQANPEKSKSVKKAPLTKKELENSMTSLLDDYFNSGDVQVATSAIKDLNAPNKFISDSIYKMMLNNVDKSDTEREKVMNLIVGMKPENLVTSETFMGAYRSLLEKLQELETDVPLIKSYVASYAAHAIGGNVISLSDLAEVLDKGAHYPLFLISLQQMHKQKDKEWLVNVFNESKINLQDMLPENDQSKEKMMEILEDRGLSFLFPLLRIQSELWKQIQTDPSATAIFKWIKDKVQNDLHQSPGFVNILTTSILKYITKASTLSENCDPSIPPEKHLVEKEKDMLDKLKICYGDSLCISTIWRLLKRKHS